jgi:hypothetical protein
MDTRTDYSVFRTVHFARHQDRNVIHPGSTILQIPLPVRKVTMYYRWSFQTTLGLAHAVEAAKQLGGNGSQGWSKSSIPGSIV